MLKSLVSILFLILLIGSAFSKKEKRRGRGRSPYKRKDGTKRLPYEADGEYWH